jgi:putative CocE/NonD family hydrolase
MIVERDIEIPMADGTALAADVFRPPGGPAVPAVMSMGPYGKGVHFRDSHPAEWDRLLIQHPEVLGGSSGEHTVWELPDPEQWVPHGYAVVRAGSRGAGRSPGYLDPFSPQEAADFCQAIEWAAAQPWSTGKVGLCGVSCYAMAQWLAAARQPPHLAAIIVWEGAQDFYRDVTHHGGILSSVFPRLWYQRRVVCNQHGQGQRGLPDGGPGGLAAGPVTLPGHVLQAQRADLVVAIRDHHLDDEFHQARTADMSKVTVPLLSAVNWAGFGLHARGNFTGFCGAASARKWLQVHGGRHEEWFYLPDSISLQRRFFGCFLKGTDTAWLAEPPVQLHIRRPGERFTLRKEHTGHWPAPAGPSCTSTPPPAACNGSRPACRPRPRSPPSARA